MVRHFASNIAVYFHSRRDGCVEIVLVVAEKLAHDASNGRHGGVGRRHVLVGSTSASVAILPAQEYE